jgi:hypothetical protein
LSMPPHQRVSRRPQLRSLLDLQRTLGNRAVLRLIGIEPHPEEPASPVEPAEPPETPSAPDLAGPLKRRWFPGALVSIATVEAVRRWYGG